MLSDEGFKVQVSEKNVNGGMLNIRADSAAELQTILNQLAATGVGVLYPSILPAVSDGSVTTPAPAPQPATQTPASPPQAAPAQQQQQVVWATGSNPRGDTFEYRPTTNLPTETFKNVIKQRIAEAGEDPNHFAIFDERMGARGLEAGGSNYGPATVKTTTSHPAHAAMKQGNKVSAAFFVDFTKDGNVKVNATNKFKEALEGAGQPAASVPSNDVPF